MAAQIAILKRKLGRFSWAARSGKAEQCFSTALQGSRNQSCIVSFRKFLLQFQTLEYFWILCHNVHMLVKPEETRFYWKLLYTGGRMLLYLNVHTSMGVRWTSILCITATLTTFPWNINLKIYQQEWGPRHMHIKDACWCQHYTFKVIVWWCQQGCPFLRT